VVEEEEVEEEEDQRLCKAMNEVDAGRGRATPQEVAGRVMVKEEGSFKQDLRAHVTAGVGHSAHGAGLRWATYESESDTILSLSLSLSKIAAF
jgi:hypothetical protein